MIVRINQIEVGRTEEEARWASEGLLGPVDFAWPAAARGYEVLILEHDEQEKKLDEPFRQTQMRLMIPQAVAALLEPDEQVVVRLDGPFIAGELLGMMTQLTQPDSTGRFAISNLRKFDRSAQEIIGSVRVQPSPQACATLCMDPEIGLDRSVRLRAYAAPEELINPLLDIDEPLDERWREILPRCGFVLSTTRQLRALQIVTERFAPQEVKNRLMQRLMDSAKAQARAVG